MEEAILGMPGPWAVDNREVSDHYTSKIGGIPDWPFAESSLRPDLLLCSVCGSNLCLVAQVYAPISRTNLTIEERTIYIFCCKGTQCESYRAFRVQKVDMDTEGSVVANQEAASPLTRSTSHSLAKSKPPHVDLYSSFGAVQNDDSFENASLNLEELERAFSQATSPASSSTRKNTKKKSKSSSKLQLVSPRIKDVKVDTTVVPCFYIYDVVEKSSKDVLSVCSSYSSLSIKEKEKEKNDNAQEEVWEQEGYEYDRSLSADRTYLKFKKRVDADPMQCFRYSYGGKPLLATGDLGDPGTCSLCSGSRHYEMQLMPPILYFLQQAAEGDQKELLDKWNWMTILLYTCSKSCCMKVNEELMNPDGWIIAEEAVVAQFERLPNNELAGVFAAS